jgi:hypothetical protein
MPFDAAAQAESFVSSRPYYWRESLAFVILWRQYLQSCEDVWTGE